MRNKEKHAAYMRAYRKKYPERMARIGAKYYKNNKHKRRAYIASIPEKVRFWNLKTKYGITKIEFENLLQKQQNKCAICFIDFQIKSPHVDHCHKTGKIRGLLCHNCNTGFGLFMENPEILESAINYARRMR